MELYITSFILLTIIGVGMCLECYVCQNQMDNRDKCIKTSVQCREEDDTCLTHIEWRAPDLWTPRSEKIHYIHKSCNSSTYCSNKQREIGLRCMRDWYRDWECMECCQGDRCNFYITLGSSEMLPSLVLVVASLGTVIALHWR